jgi:hypothetical protein
MNSLPLISHHLFVAALENEDRPGVKSSPNPTAIGTRSRPAEVIPLELLTDDEAFLDTAVQPLRVGPSPRAT